MSQELIRGGDCCTPCCDDAVVTQVPGPPGAAGADGTNGTNGASSFSIITSAFIMPALDGTSGSTSILDARWMVVGETVYMFGIGYLEIVTVVLAFAGVGPPGAVTFKNPSAYSGLNAAPGTNAAGNAKVTPSGIRGPSGISPSVFLNDLSPTTTKGDIIVDNGGASPNASDVRLGVGTNGKVLTADSTQPTGLNYKAVDLSGSATAITGATPIANGGTANTTRQAAINALCDKPGATSGDMFYYNGTNWIRFPLGTALQQLRTNSGVTAPEWFSPSGGVVQMVSANTNAYSLGSTIIPGDDTIPQSSEGTELLNLTITPSTLTSRLVITGSVPCACGSIEAVTIALFVNGVANSLGAVVKELGLNASTQIEVDAEYSPGAIAAKTISLRIGSAIGGQWEVNGASGFRVLGGAQHVYLRVVEYL